MSSPNHSFEHHFTVKKLSLLGLVKSVGLFLGFLFILGVIALVVIYPLWYLAVEHKELYSLLIGIGLALVVAVLFGLRLYRSFRDARLDEFFSRVLTVFLWLFLLALQVLYALLNILLLNVGELAGVNDPSFLFTAVSVCVLFLLFLLLYQQSIKKRLLLRVGTVIVGALFVLNTGYWATVCVVRQLFVLVIVQIIVLFGFFFFQKLTKIIREKKKADAQGT